MAPFGATVRRAVPHVGAAAVAGRSNATMNTQSNGTLPGERPAVSIVELYAAIWRFAAGARMRYIFALLLLVASQSIKLLVPWLAAQAINTVQVGGTDQLVKAGLITMSIFLVYVCAWAMHGPGRIMERNVG